MWSHVRNPAAFCVFFSNSTFSYDETNIKRPNTESKDDTLTEYIFVVGWIHYSCLSSSLSKDLQVHYKIERYALFI